MMKLIKLFVVVAIGLHAASAPAAGVVYEGGAGPGNGKHIVLISGDEEYRSEEALPQLGMILAKHHGFKCTVLFAIDDGRESQAAAPVGKVQNPVRTKVGEINPNISNIPGLEALATADLMVIFTRFRDLPDEQMKHIVDYVEAGKPIVGIRTATHAFNIPAGEKYAKYSYNFKGADYTEGFGRQVLGETWINHHGRHGSQSTRGIIAEGQESHPILRGIKDGDIWGPTDVYGVRLPLPGDSQPLVLGQVLAGMNSTDPPASATEDKKSKKTVDPNNPMMPIAWTKTYKGSAGNQARVFCSTIGAANDLASEGTRRLLVNACFWAVGLEDKIPERSNVATVGDFQPSNFKTNGFKTGVKPEDYVIK